MKPLWNKGLAIWFPRPREHAAEPLLLRSVLARLRTVAGQRREDRCACKRVGYERAKNPRRGESGVECQEA